MMEEAAPEGASEATQGDQKGSSEGGEEGAQLSKSKKRVSWAEEAHLKQVFYFELDETERGKLRLSCLLSSSAFISESCDSFFVCVSCLFEVWQFFFALPK